jgi:hypothetical protein
MKNRNRTLTILFLSVFAAGLCVWGQYAIEWHTIDGGGGASTGGIYSVSGTIGQPDANEAAITGGALVLNGGFWASAVQTPGAPYLSIVTAGLGQATISWTPAEPGWILQEKASLTAPSWTNSPSMTTNPVVVPATLPAVFYRLHKP